MHRAWQHSCTYCSGGSGNGRARLRQLQLLALLEHPEALPAELALRLAAELLALTGEGSAFRCEAFEENRP
jgi:hypothetical protein